MTRRTVRARAEYLGGSRVKYVYPCGHYRTETLTQGGPGPRGREPMMPAMVKKLARYWGDGVNVKPCTTCARKQRGGRS